MPAGIDDKSDMNSVFTEDDPDSNTLGSADHNDDTIDDDAARDELQEGAGGEADPDPEEADTDGADEGGLDAQLLSDAYATGLTEDDVKAMGGEAAVRSAMSVIDRHIAELGRKDETPPKEAKKQEARKEHEPVKIEKFDLKFDDNPAETLDKLNEHYHKQLTGLMEQVRNEFDDIRATDEARESRAFGQRFDGLVDGLDEAWRDMLGKGRSADLPRQGKHAKARTELIAEMNVIAAGYERAGRDVPPEDVLFRKALGSLHGDKALELARKQASSDLSDKLKKRGGQRRGRPTPRAQPSGESGPSFAKKNLAKKLKEYGAAEPDDTDTSLLDAQK